MRLTALVGHGRRPRAPEHVSGVYLSNRRQYQSDDGARDTRPVRALPVYYARRGVVSRGIAPRPTGTVGVRRDRQPGQQLLVNFRFETANKSGYSTPFEETPTVGIGGIDVNAPV
jgi:hypothetical protein